MAISNVLDFHFFVLATCVHVRCMFCGHNIFFLYFRARSPSSHAPLTQKLSSEFQCDGLRNGSMMWSHVLSLQMCVVCMCMWERMEIHRYYRQKFKTKYNNVFVFCSLWTMLMIKRQQRQWQWQRPRHPKRPPFV